MRSLWWAGIGLAFCVLAGCQANNPAGAPATDDQVRALRQSVNASDPNACVGPVIAVRPQDKYLAVGDVPVRDLREGDVFVIVDSHQHPIAHANVRALTADAAQLKYWPDPGGRDPKPGDMAVHFSR
jgi:hypothetical protein